MQKRNQKQPSPKYPTLISSLIVSEGAERSQPLQNCPLADAGMSIWEDAAPCWGARRGLRMTTNEEAPRSQYLFPLPLPQKHSVTSHFNYKRSCRGLPSKWWKWAGCTEVGNLGTEGPCVTHPSPLKILRTSNFSASFSIRLRGGIELFFFVTVLIFYTSCRPLKGRGLRSNAPGYWSAHSGDSGQAGGHQRTAKPKQLLSPTGNLGGTCPWRTLQNAAVIAPSGRAGPPFPKGPEQQPPSRPSIETVSVRLVSLFLF